MLSIGGLTLSFICKTLLLTGLLLALSWLSSCSAERLFRLTLAPAERPAVGFVMLMACGGYCYWKGGLVRVDLLYNKFPVKVRCGINIATAILVLICMGLVFIYGINIFLLSFRLNERISSVWGSPMWTIRFWVPLGAALMFIQAISELIKNVAAMAGKIELTNNSDEVAEAIEIVKSAEHLPDETGKEDIQ